MREQVSNLQRSFNTPNANMADHSVGARDESNESKASEALMFCFDNAFPGKSCFVVELVPFFLPTRFCVPECHRNRVESSTAEKVLFFSVFSFACGGKPRSSWSPKELLKFRLESILENV